MSKSPSDINKVLNFVIGYTEQPSIGKILKTCNLRPCAGKHPLIWYDEFGYQVKIEKYKSTVDSAPKINLSTDLFRLQSPVVSIRDSQIICLGIGNGGQFVISPLCHDDLIRSYYYDGDEIIVQSPLLIGIPILSKFLDHFGKNIVELREDSPFFPNFDWWVIPYPIDPIFSGYFKDHKILHSLLLNKSNE